MSLGSTPTSPGDRIFKSWRPLERPHTVVPVDVWLPGAPPTPFSILHALLLALGRLPAGAGEGARS
jgi:Ni,Fe-hydrogenase III small subunit